MRVEQWNWEEEDTKLSSPSTKKEKSSFLISLRIRSFRKLNLMTRETSKWSSRAKLFMAKAEKMATLKIEIWI